MGCGEVGEGREGERRREEWERLGEVGVSGGGGGCPCGRPGERKADSISVSLDGTVILFLFFVCLVLVLMCLRQSGLETNLIVAAFLMCGGSEFQREGPK